MLDLIIGEKKEDALHLAELFLKMIKDSITDEEMEELDEAAALQDVAHMPARVKCAVLVGTPWKKCLTWTSSKTQSSKSQKPRTVPRAMERQSVNIYKDNAKIWLEDGR